VAVLPAVLVFAARFTVVESPQWLAAGGRLREAEAALLRLLRRVPSYPTKVELSAPPAPAKEGGGSFAGLWRGKNLRATVLASASVLGAAVTKMFAIDTNGKNLEAVGGD
jgi:hypothetical protein